MNWQNVTVKLSALQPWEHNPRSMTKRQAQRLLKSWQDLGQFQTIAIGPRGQVYDGHQRLSALLAAHGPQFAIDARQSDRELSDDERRYLTTQANLPVGQWNWDALAGWDAAQLQEWGFDDEALKTWNSDAANLATMLTAEQQGSADAKPQIDRAAELNEKWQVKTGDLWRIGEHRLLCGDSTRREDVERVMGEEKANLIVTDPPYGVDYEGGANNAIKRDKLDGDSDSKLYDAFLRVAPLNGECALYMWHADRRANEVYQSAINNGFEVRSQIIWHKLKAHYGAWMAQYKQKHEPCIYCVKGSPKFSGATNEVTVWEYDQPGRNEYHPTEKPTPLIQRAIGNHPYNTVYDPFVGSGTTIVACQNLQRKCRAIEISPNYCAVILERMATAFPGIEIERISEAVLTHGT